MSATEILTQVANSEAKASKARKQIVEQAIADYKAKMARLGLK